MWTLVGKTCRINSFNYSHLHGRNLLLEWWHHGLPLCGTRETQSGEHGWCLWDEMHGCESSSSSAWTIPKELVLTRAVVAVDFPKTWPALRDEQWDFSSWLSPPCDWFPVVRQRRFWIRESSCRNVQFYPNLVFRLLASQNTGRPAEQEMLTCVQMMGRVRFCCCYRTVILSCRPNVMIGGECNCDDVHVLHVLFCFCFFPWWSIILLLFHIRTHKKCTKRPIGLCYLSNNIRDYHFVSQGKTTIPDVDDGEEMKVTDVSITLLINHHTQMDPKK